MRHAKSLNFPSTAAKLIIPDLISDCPFALHLNPDGANAGINSDAWLSTKGGLGAKKQNMLRGLKCGLLAAMTYPDAPPYELRTCCDFLSFLFHLDDLSDGMDKRGTLSTRKVVIGSMCDPTFDSGTRIGRMARDIWRRFAPLASTGTKARFISTFELFFRAISQQAFDRRAGVVLDLKSYICVRRDTSGLMGHEAVETMGEATNDLVSWSNDIFSFKVENARDDTHNMISISMLTLGLSLQDAVDYVGELCSASIARFLAGKRRLPSFDNGGRVDREVGIYVRGLEDWIVGSLHWSFESARYFGGEGGGIRKTRVVRLGQSSSQGRRGDFLSKLGPWTCMMPHDMMPYDA
ncbi:hypothetical protein EW145_g7101 [Phellinidium pouzarii]|uniref:Terpene synthase n=1 Tax=Phellinidium pouzarii TaxID=167371 RepID=A0A4S4KP22_9AGAM|nr:hypothetical protein EW145_g7101 [Phellinidium pouzarii]